MMHPLLTEMSTVDEMNHMPATSHYSPTDHNWSLGLQLQNGPQHERCTVQVYESTLTAQSDESHPGDSEIRNCINTCMCDEIFPFSCFLI